MDEKKKNEIKVNERVRIFGL
ncbi:hypothetical protein HKBW3S09_01158, partial [Candidatus Hakubella thermalkaliphila]